MISLEDLRKIDPDLKNMSDERLFEVRAKLYALGQLAFDSWDKNQPTRDLVSKNPVGIVTLPHDKNIM